MARVNYSGLFDGHYGENYSQVWNKNPHDDSVARTLRTSRYGTRVLNELMQTLNGTAAGSTALATEPRVKPKDRDSSGQLGGLREVEQYEIINRVTTAADQTYVDSILNRSEAGMYVEDASGNKTTDAKRW